jgi:hypothetical protein
VLHRADFVAHIGKANILPHVAAALERAEQVFLHREDEMVSEGEEVLSADVADERR